MNDDGYDDVIIGADSEDGGADSAGKTRLFEGDLPAWDKPSGARFIGLRNPYPDPSEGFAKPSIIAPLPLWGKATLALYDALGRLVRQADLVAPREDGDLRMHWSANADLSTRTHCWRFTAGGTQVSGPWVLIR